MAIFVKPQNYSAYSQQNYLYIYSLSSRIGHYLMCVGLASIVVVVISAIIKEFSKYGYFSFFLIILFAPVFWLYYFLLKMYKKNWLSYNKGMWGEKFLKGRLSELSDDFFVFPNVFINRRKGNIDFIVVGPTGIFVVETKECNFLDLKRFRSNVKKVAGQARFLKEEILEHLKKDKIFFIEPVLVISDKRSGIKKYNKTMVLNRDEIVDYIKKYQKRYDKSFISEVKVGLECFINSFN